MEGETCWKKNGRNVPLEKGVTLSKQGLKDAYMPLFGDLHVMFAQFTSQSKFHVTLSILGSVQSKKPYLYSEGCSTSNNPSTRMLLNLVRYVR